MNIALYLMDVILCLAAAVNVYAGIKHKSAINFAVATFIITLILINR